MGLAVLVLSGPDGSGKTTLARLLRARCGSCGYFWLRGSHLLASLLLRLLSRFSAFQGSCNPYYGVCVPGGLRGLWVHVEFWSAVPRLLMRGLLSRLYGLLVCDRGALDLVVWVAATLRHPGFISSLYGRFLLSLASREPTVYLRADRAVLAGRGDVPEGFLAYEYALYEVLSRYFALVSIDTGRCRPAECLALLAGRLGEVGLRGASRS
ncbi:MAG: thymidylate kinase [Infirmifilum sp.]